MAHTPGPWLVDEMETRTAIKSGKRTVAYVQMARDDYENANLIVAAPELLAACKGIDQLLLAGRQVVSGTTADHVAGKIARGGPQVLHGLHGQAIAKKSGFILIDPGGFFFKEAAESVEVGLGKTLEQIHIIAVSGR